VVFYPVAENVHRNHVLHLAMMPGRIPKPVEKKAQALAARIARGLNHVGVMAVEMFLLPGGKLLVNEIAPRTHNSGHPTFGAGSLSQFELHLRAIVGLPVVAPRMAAPAVIVNLLGDLWKNGKPVWEKALSLPGLALHLYGKSDARPGRKMGHMLVTGKTAKAAAQVAERALALLKKG
jgi:5-(carboxyamino)imidazole ribonucleotide synthase